MKSHETINSVSGRFASGHPPPPPPPEIGCQHHHQKGKKGQTKMLWKAISLLLFFIMFANTFFCSILLYNYSFSSLENQMMLRSLITKLQQQSIFHDNDLDSFNFGVAVERKPQSTGFTEEYRQRGFPRQEFERLMKLPLPSTTGAPGNRADCPPCPTCKPTIEIPTNKDPVSLLNSVYRERAVYYCITVCTQPPIHVANLTITGEDTIWEGRGSTRQRAKHAAAYAALDKLKPELAAEAINAGFLEQEYNPPCTGLLPHLLPAIESGMRIKC